MRKPTATFVAVAAGVLAVAGPAMAQPAFKSRHIGVTPSAGSPLTTFELTFRNPERTGVMGGTERHDLLSASVPNGGNGCLENFDTRPPDAHAGAVVHVKLSPRKLHGHWCVGTYHGQIEEIQTAVCPHGTFCPTYALLRGVVGNFTLRVKPSADKQPPRFGGLLRAFACTPGPQRPGQTTPYTLSWQAATDNLTPSSQIVYDVYYATRSGAEDFAMPTWTTAPGVTSFRTPGLPSHGAAYFVVRAQDAVGNEDRNTVERAGVDPCF
jgi:hypothetical protein